jgi:hypothetical protein
LPFTRFAQGAENRAISGIFLDCSSPWTYLVNRRDMHFGNNNRLPLVEAASARK